MCVSNKKGIAAQPNRLYADVCYKERERNNNREDGMAEESDNKRRWLLAYKEKNGSKLMVSSERDTRDLDT